MHNDPTPSRFGDINELTRVFWEKCMNESGKDTAAANAAAGTQPAAKPANNQARGQRPPGKAVSDPREVATLVLARMNVVNNKKDELTIAIKGLSDITQQLSLAYAEQLRAIERLSKRVQSLEAAAKHQERSRRQWGSSARSRAGLTAGPPPASKGRMHAIVVE